MHDETFALTQYANYGFNSFAVFNGNVYGASEDGVFRLENGDTDNDASIDSFFEFWIGDVGAINIKRVRAIHIGGEFSGDLTATLTDDDGISQSFDIAVEKTTRQHCGARVFIPRTQTGRYWKLKIANQDGSHFAVDRIDVTWNIMAGSKQNGR